MVLTGKKSARDVKDFPEEFQQKVNKAVGKQHLQITTEIWMTEDNPPTPAKEEICQILTNDEFPLLDIKMGWYPDGDL